MILQLVICKVSFSHFSKFFNSYAKAKAYANQMTPDDNVLEWRKLKDETQCAVDSVGNYYTINEIQIED